MDNASAALNRLVLPAIYGELVRWDWHGTPFAYLATEVPTVENGLVRFAGRGVEEHLEVEFCLRAGLVWQDGEPLTTDDIVFSWSEVMQATWPGSHLGHTGWAPEIYVDSVDCISPRRVVFRFMNEKQARQAARTGGRLGDGSLYAGFAEQDGPVVPLDYLDVGRNVFPRHLLEGVDPSIIASSSFGRRPVFAGPFRVVGGGGLDEPVVLEAFEQFVLGPPGIDRVVLGSGLYSASAVPYWQPPDALADALLAGAIQAQVSYPAVDSREGEDPTGYDGIHSSGAGQVEWVPENDWEVLDFNLDNPHLADPLVREAIAHAIDRQQIIDVVLDGHASLMQSYLPGWHPLYAGNAVLPEYDYNPRLARDLLQQAGYDLSRPTAKHPTRGLIVLQFASMDVTNYPRPPIAEIIRKNLAEIGIEVQVHFYSWGEFEAEDCSGVRNGRRFDLGMAAWAGATELYSVGYLEESTTSKSIPTIDNSCPIELRNWSGWRNPKADAIVERLEDGRLAIENPGLYRHLWIEHQVLWATEIPSLPLFNPERPVTLSPFLMGVEPSPFSLGDTWNIHEWQFAPP